MAQKPKRKYD